MEFIDTQIVSYKFKNNKELFDGDINGRYISSIVALEFLGIMEKNKNKAKMYPMKLKGFHPEVHVISKNKKSLLELGKNNTDKYILDFNGEFDNIVIYSNEAISYLINKKNINTLLFFARNSLDKKNYRYFRERVEFLVDNNIMVIPITQEIAILMQRLYEHIKREYNVKDNYRNSFMDLLILATAIVKNGVLISKDKELNKALKKCCEFLNISTYAEGISSISYCNEAEEKERRNDNKNYINNSWKIVIRKEKIIGQYI